MMRFLMFALSAVFFSSLCLLLNSSEAKGQSHYFDQWYFGSHAGLDFRSGVPVIISGDLVTTEGCASICNPENGDLLFYTNGVVVYNSNGVMANGTGLYGSESSTQSALIVPYPSHPDLFLLFTSDAGLYANGGDVKGINYSLVDMGKNGGLGEVVDKNNPLLPNAAEKLVAVRHCNGKDFWVIAHEIGSRRFFTWEVTEDGVNPAPIISDIGLVHSSRDPVAGIGVMKVSPNGRYLVSVIADQGELFLFNNSDGTVYKKLDDIPAAYGASFSANSTYLYVEEGTSIFRYTMQEISPDEISDSRKQLIRSSGANGGELYALQLAPDGKIYVAEGSRNVGRIDEPDDPGAMYRSEVIQFDHNNQSTLLGLPNCIDSYFSSTEVHAGVGELDAIIRLSDSVICAGEGIEFSDASLGEPLEFQWRFEGGSIPSSEEQNPGTIRFTQPGTYQVLLRVIRGCAFGQDSVMIRVEPVPEVDAGEEQVICPGDSARLSPTGAEIYQWESSPTLSCLDCSGPFASPTTDTWYYVRGKNSTSDCESIDSVMVKVRAQPEVRVNQDTIICLGESIRLRATGATSYQWEDSPDLSCLDCPDPIATPVKTTIYRVKGKNGGDCEGIDSVRVEVRVPPLAEAGEDQSFCAGTSLLLGSDLSPLLPDLLYQWEPSDDLVNADSPRPVARPQQTKRYYLRVTDRITGCSATDSVLVTLSRSFIADAGEDRTICRGTVVQLGDPEGDVALEYQWEPVEGLDNPEVMSPLANPTATTRYHLRVYDQATGCESFDTVTLTLFQPPIADAGDDATICLKGVARLGGVDQVDPNLSYSWNPPDGLDDPFSSHPLASPSESMVYVLEVTDLANGCSSLDTVRVDLQANIPVRASIRRDYHALIDEPLEIVVESDAIPAGSGVFEIQFELEYDEWTIRIDAESVQDLLDRTMLKGWSVHVLKDSPGLLSLRFVAPPGLELEGSGELIRFIGRLYLGERPGTELTFRLGTMSECMRFAPEPGYARPDTICGLNFRLIEVNAAKFSPPRAVPNPSGKEVEIEFGIGLEGEGLLEVFDVQGRQVGVLLQQNMKPGLYRVEWNAEDAGAGLYWLRLQSGETVLTSQVVVQE